MTTSKYSQLLFKADEYVNIGPFRFPIFNDLTPGEARKIEELRKRNTEMLKATLQLAKKIAEEKGISTGKAYELLGNITAASGEDKELVYGYIDEMQRINDAQPSDLDDLAEYCTVVIQMRGELQDTSKPGLQYIPLSDWTREDTDGVPRATLREIQDYMIREMNGGVAPNPQAPEIGAPSPAPSQDITEVKEVPVTEEWELDATATES